MKKSKKVKLVCYINGNVIRYKHGSVSVVSYDRCAYVDKPYNGDTIELVIDKTTHPVWSVAKKVTRI